MKDWPLHCEAEFDLLLEDEENPGGELVWRKEKINMLNMIATNCHKLGVDHPIHPDTEIDNGWLDVVFLGGGHTRTAAARAGMYMKSGKFLANHKAMSSRRVKELKMTPTCDSDVPILIDGDPWDVAPMHVKVIHRGLTVFCKEQPWKPEKAVAAKARKGAKAGEAGEAGEGDDDDEAPEPEAEAEADDANEADGGTEQAQEPAQGEGAPAPAAENDGGVAGTEH